MLPRVSLESLRRGRCCRQANSGYSQGVFMKRHRVAKRAGGGGGAEDFVTLFDFSGTSEVSLYNRTFRLVTCSAFTEKVRRCPDATARTGPREANAPRRRGSAAGRPAALRVLRRRVGADACPRFRSQFFQVNNLSLVFETQARPRPRARAAACCRARARGASPRDAALVVERRAVARAGVACDFGRLSPQCKAAFPSQ